jgi:2'-5' RNA ligase
VTTDGTFRAFFAVPFSPSTAGALEAAAGEWIATPAGAAHGNWRATPAERIHLTLKFLGDAALDLIPRLEEALRAAAGTASPFPLELGGWVLLPGPPEHGNGDPRVLAVGVSDPTGTLPRLAALLEERAEALGFPREARPFTAHVTVARRRPGRGGRQRGGGVPPPASGKADERIATETVGRVVLLRSTLGPEGPTYAVVAEAALGGHAGGTGGGRKAGSTSGSTN